MKRYAGSLVLVVILFSGICAVQAVAQVDHIVIPAGTPEDHDLQAITSEADEHKKLSMYEEFVTKFAASPAAAAYGNWQLSQAYQATGDLQKALDYGDKALAGSPHNLDILVSQASIAQQAKNKPKLMDYAATGGEVCKSVGKQPKPEGMSDEDFATQNNSEKDAAKNSCSFLENSAFNLIPDEKDARTRMAYIERFNAAFPESTFQDQVSSYAMYTLGPGQLNDQARLVSFGEKTLATNPNSLPALLLLASFYSDDPKAGSLGKSITYAQKAIEVAKPDAPDADKSRKLSAGVAHSTIGYDYMKQEKTAAAVPELKSAVALLKGQDEQQYSIALYRLGFAYGKLNRTTEARDVLTEAVKIPGPMQPMSQKLLTTVNAARAKGK